MPCRTPRPARAGLRGVAALGLLIAGLGAQPVFAHPSAQDAAPSVAPAATTPAELPVAAVDVLLPETAPLLGERFELRLRASDILQFEVDGSGLAGALRLLGVRPSGTDAQPELALELRATREGRHALSGLVLVDGDRRSALPPTEVEVLLDLPPGQLPRVAAPLPPLELPLPAASTRPFALGLAVFLALWLLAVIAAGRRRVVPVVAPRPPELLAIEALAALRRRPPQTPEEVSAFVDAASGVLRLYVERRFELRAPECTSEEFLEQAARHPALADWRPRLSGFLSTSDLVKFARARPRPADVLALLDTAEALVVATCTVPVDASPPLQAPTPAGAPA